MLVLGGCARGVPTGFRLGDASGGPAGNFGQLAKNILNLPWPAIGPLRNRLASEVNWETKS